MVFVLALLHRSLRFLSSPLRQGIFSVQNYLFPLSFQHIEPENLHFFHLFLNFFPKKFAQFKKTHYLCTRKSEMTRIFQE